MGRGHLINDFGASHRSEILDMRALTFLLTFLFAGSVFANECDTNFIRYFTLVERMMSAKNPWRSIEKNAFRFSLTDRDKHVVYFNGFIAQELEDIGVKSFLVCPQDPKVFVASQAPQEFFEGDLQAPFDGRSDLEKKLGRTLIALILPFKNIDPVMANKMEIPAVLSNVMVHEDFHGQQTSENSYPSFPTKFEQVRLEDNYPPSEPSLCDKKSGYGCRIAGSCLQSREWMTEVQVEMNDINFVQANWFSLSITDLKAVASRIVARRGTGTEKDLNHQCWNGIRDTERFEGTANYFAGALGRNAGIPNSSEMTVLKVAGAYRATNRNMFTFGTEFFYFSGAMMCRIMERLDSTGKWQSEIQSGKPIDIALRGVLENP